MFGRVQSGIFGGRQRSAVAPAPQQQERPPSPFPLPLGPPRAERELPLHGQWVREVQGPEYVAPYHLRYYPLGRQIGQADENRYAVRKVFPPAKDVVIQNPDDSIVIGNEKKSKQEQSAQAAYDKKRKERLMARGGVIKSYGVGSSSIKDVIVSSRGGAGGGGKQPPKRNPTDISNEISDIDNELRRLKREKKRLQESNDPGAEDLIVEINDAIRILSQRKIRVMRDA
jgi:hypothetical protein